MPLGHAIWKRQRWPQQRRLGLCLVMLLMLSPPWTAAAQPPAYVAVQQAVAAGLQDQTIAAARAFLQRFPHHAERSRVWFWLAEALYATRQYREAVEVYGEFLRQETVPPQAATALYHLGRSALALHYYNVALTAFLDLLERFPGHAEVEQIVLHLASIYFTQGRFDEALPLYQQLLQVAEPPLSVPALYLQLGYCALYLQQFERAQQYYRYIMRNYSGTPFAPRARYQLGVVALVQGQPEIARGHFQSLLPLPGAISRQAHWALAWMLYRQGEFAQAVTQLRQQGLLAQPSTTDEVLAKSYDLMLLHDYQDAIVHLSKALARVQEEEQQQHLLWLLARAHAAAGQWSQALQVLDDFVRRFPASERQAQAQHLRAELLLQHREAAALSAYREALSITHDGAQIERTLTAMAEVYEEQRAIAEAIAMWQRLLQEFPLSPRRIEMQLRLGAMLVRQGAVVQAATLYRQVLDTDPIPSARLRLQLHLAWAYLKGGNHQKALQLYVEIIRAVPEEAVVRQARFWRGWLLQQQERYAASNAEWRVLLRLAPTGERRGDILWRLGGNLIALQRYEEASTYLQQVLTTYATSPYASPATWQLQWCMLKLQQYRRALQGSPHFVRQDPLAFFRVAERFDQGERLFKAHQYAQARAVFQRIVALPVHTPLSADAAFMIAASYAAEGEAQRALQHYHRVTQQYGRSNITALAYYRQGTLLEEAELLAMAVPALHAAERWATEDQLRYQVRYRLGKIYVALQHKDRAVAVFQRLLHDETTMAATAAERLSIGLMLQQLKAYEVTLQAFQQVLQYAQADDLRAEAQFWIAETYQLRGETQTALATYRLVARRFPQQYIWAVTALFRAGEIYETLQQYREAMTMYKHVMTANSDNQRGRFAAERLRYLKAKLEQSQRQGG